MISIELIFDNKTNSLKYLKVVTEKGVARIPPQKLEEFANQMIISTDWWHNLIWDILRADYGYSIEEGCNLAKEIIDMIYADPDNFNELVGAIRNRQRKKVKELLREWLKNKKEAK